MTQWHADYLHSHICALTLIADDFVTDPTDIRNDLQVDTSRLNTLFRELGCQVGPPTEMDKKKLGMKENPAVDGVPPARRQVAKLTLPLSFPKMRTKSMKRR